MMASLVAAIGGCIVIVSMAISGLRLHRMVERHAPGLAALIPRDGLVLLGIAAGLFVLFMG